MSQLRSALACVHSSAGELALSVLLVIGAALLVRSFLNVQNVPAGFDSRGVLTFELALTGPQYDSGARVRDTYHELWRRFDGLPGVESSGAVSALPLSQMMAWGPITVEGRWRSPKIGVEVGDAAGQGGIAAALATLVAPIAAVLPFVDLGLAEDVNCSALLAGRGEQPREG